MAMLAGPRRKQKVVNLRAKNSSWSNDSGKFGQRMLEKMGWSSGKGLGAKENGIVEHVVARYKNDEKGLGYEDKNDQWTKHEDDFNALLANLSNTEKEEDKLHSGISLEAKSKTSKARIHYHKYTRGKDLSKYSEKDLANIFGKKTLKAEIVDEPIKNNAEEPEQKFSVKGSMEDYFKNKISSLKNNNKKTAPEYENECNYAFQGFSNTNDEQAESESDQANVNFQPFSFYTNNGEKKDTDTSACIEKVKKNKKKKNKIDIVETTDNAESCETSQPKTKKSKKQKIFEDNSEEIQVKKTKKRKNIESAEQVVTPSSEIVDTCDVKPKKKKKKNKNNE